MRRASKVVPNRKTSPTGRSGRLLLALAIAAAALTVIAAPASADPIVSTKPATEVLYNSALVHGIVDPGPDETAYWFQYTTDPAEGPWFYGPGYIGPTVPAGGPQEVSEKLFGEFEYFDLPFGIELEANTTYFYRLAAVKAECCFNGVYSPPPYESFKTLPVAPPEVISAAITNVTNKSADLSGVVERTSSNPDQAFDARCSFEYMTDAQYKPRSEKQRITVKAGGGTFTLSYSQRIGSTPQTTGPIPYNAPKAQIQAELESLPFIGPGAVSVTGGPGSPTGAFPYTVNFIGPKANTNVQGIGTDGTNLTLSPEEGPQAFTTGVTDGHPEGFEQATPLPCSTERVTAPGQTPETATLTGLQPNTVYHVQLSAKNSGGKAHKVAGVFTSGSVPKTETMSAGHVLSTTADLGGRVSPENAPLSYQFEWGTSSSYGNLLPAAPEPLESIDEGTHIVTKPLAGLAPETEYHYRILATNTVTKQTVKGDDKTFKTLAPPPAQPTCTNERSRIGAAAHLPDCRAYEFASPQTNYAALEGGLSVVPDGSAIEWIALDAPLESESSEALANWAVSRRNGGSGSGWSTVGLNPPLVEQAQQYAQLGAATFAIREDFKEWLVTSRQKIAGPDSPVGGVNYYVRKADGSFEPITKTGSTYAWGGGCCVASADFTHFYYEPEKKQLKEDPLEGGNAYEYSNGALRLVGYLPGETTPAPQGAKVPSPMNGKGGMMSGNGKYVGFVVNGDPRFYARVDTQSTIEVSKSQRDTDDPAGTTNGIRPAGIAEDGSAAYFKSSSELTNDANTGETEGVNNDAGADLYRYDFETKKLTDLTVDTNPADKETGANFTAVVGHDANYNYIYFTARGEIVPGGTRGVENLYVWHDGEINYVAESPSGGFESGWAIYTTPDGRHILFASTKSQTAYDNTSAINGEPLQMLYKYSYKGPLECVTCRPNGTQPTAGTALMPFYSRGLSDDGSRAFFESTDALLPESSNGLSNVYEFEDGELKLLSPPNSERTAHFYGASASGDDVFIQTFGELTPEGQGEVMGLYDAHVNGELLPDRPLLCQGENCRTTPDAPSKTQSPGSASFSATVRVAVSEAKASKGKTAHLRVIVPDAGDLTISGKGLKTIKKSLSNAGSETVTLTLTPAKNKRRLQKGVFNTRAEIIFTSTAGDTSRDEVALKFTAAKKKGAGK